MVYGSCRWKNGEENIKSCGVCPRFTLSLSSLHGYLGFLERTFKERRNRYSYYSDMLDNST